MWWEVVCVCVVEGCVTCVCLHGGRLCVSVWWEVVCVCLVGDSLCSGRLSVLEGLSGEGVCLLVPSKSGQFSLFRNAGRVVWLWFAWRMPVLLLLLLSQLFHYFSSGLLAGSYGRGSRGGCRCKTHFRHGDGQIRRFRLRSGRWQNLVVKALPCQFLSSDASSHLYRRVCLSVPRPLT